MNRSLLAGICGVLLPAFHGSVDAQVLDVVVGVTPNCPYGLEACWGVAREGLNNLDGVDSIVQTPDVYNCTARVRLKNNDLPDLSTWPEQFKSVVGEIQSFRGIELTVKGTVQKRGDQLFLSVPLISEPIRLAPLEHKLQWNFKKKARRGPEPEEAAAYKELVSRTKVAAQSTIEVTGPFATTRSGHVLEVREFLLVSK